MSSAICFNFDQSKILSSGNGLKVELCMNSEGGIKVKHSLNTSMKTEPMFWLKPRTFPVLIDVRFNTHLFLLKIRKYFNCLYKTSKLLTLYQTTQF